MRLRFSLAAVALLSSAGCGESVSIDEGCVYGGKHHEVGSSFPAGDACNTCSCESDGAPQCTRLACPAPGCRHGGVQYAVGDTFPAGDGCNSCSCQPDGSTACTLQDCPPPVTCSEGGYVHQVGESYTSADGCNQCTCDEYGGTCTALYCGTCIYSVVVHQSGDQFAALDGCNTCSCTDGETSCTGLSCMCDPAAEWWRDYVGKSPAECMTIDYACPPQTAAFSNDCGCGCEQGPSCPQSFDCMPPVDCDEAWIQLNCPYSVMAL